METPQPLFPNWMRGFLLITAVYNAAWGAFIYWFPNDFYQWVAQTEQSFPPVIRWQGRAVILIGIAYLFSALYPKKFWYFVGVGVFTKIVGGIWFYVVILEQQPGMSGWFHLLMNDAIWIPALLAIAIRAYKFRNQAL